MRRRRLVLLTTDFPLNQGDANFVRHEMDALAARFDEVVVFNFAREGESSHLALPANVRHGGNLRKRSTGELIRALLSPSLLGRTVKILLAELSAGAARGRLKSLLTYCVVGMRIANNRDLRTVLTETGVDSTVYSFWAMNAGLAIPWLPKNVSVNLRLHGWDLYEDRGTYLPFRRSLLRATDRILPISQHGLEYLVAHYPGEALRDKLYLRRLGTGDPGPRLARASEERFTLVSCSYLSPVKRVNRIVEALSGMNLERPILWRHFGGGDLEEQLRTQAQAVESERLTIEFAGNVDNASILEYYRGSHVDAFVNVSFAEGAPVSIMEAMSCGIPIVATAVGGTAELLGEEGSSAGELISRDFSDDELRAAIGKVLSTPQEQYQSRENWERLSDARKNSIALANLLSQDVSGQHSD